MAIDWVDLGDVPAWLAVVVGLTGAIFGVVGLVQARAAREVAADANDLAREANEYAERSADAARDSADAARKSAEVAERAEVRQTEQCDVEWAGELVDGQLIIRNDGLDAALEVDVIVMVDGEQLTERRREVPGQGGAITFDLSNRIAARRQSASRRMREAAAADIGYVASSALEISGRIYWTTPAGRPQTVRADPHKVQPGNKPRQVEFV